MRLFMEMTGWLLTRVLAKWGITKSPFCMPAIPRAGFAAERYMKVVPECSKECCGLLVPYCKGLTKIQVVGLASKGLLNDRYKR